MKGLVANPIMVKFIHPLTQALPLEGNKLIPLLVGVIVGVVVSAAAVVETTCSGLRNKVLSIFAIKGLHQRLLSSRHRTHHLSKGG
jgi:hypothetical protein